MQCAKISVKCGSKARDVFISRPLPRIALSSPSQLHPQSLHLSQRSPVRVGNAEANGCSRDGMVEWPKPCILCLAGLGAGADPTAAAEQYNAQYGHWIYNSSYREEEDFWSTGAAMWMGASIRTFPELLQEGRKKKTSQRKRKTPQNSLSQKAEVECDILRTNIYKYDVERNVCA